METNVTYRIGLRRKKTTYVNEYWDNILVYKWRVNAIYHGGDILEFLEKNQATRIPNFDGVNEYHRRVFILDI